MRQVCQTQQAFPINGQKKKCSPRYSKNKGKERKKISHNRQLEPMDMRIENINELMKTFKHENKPVKILSDLIVNICRLYIKYK